MWRLLTLTAGPVMLIGLCYAVAAPHVPADWQRQFAASHGMWQQSTHELATACERRQLALQDRLGPDWTTFVAPPFVLVGNTNEATLRGLYLETIVPTQRALEVCYFDQRPRQPISIVICRDDESFHRTTKVLEDRSRSEYAGVYSRNDRRLILNAATGEGTLAHELTHALAHADCADVPEWLDEGLASLHEESEFSADGLELVGRENWRRQFLMEALQREELPSLMEMVVRPFGRSDHPLVEYAHARYFCLYLQRKRLLGPAYRKVRANITSDPTGGVALCELLGTRDLEAIDADFRQWLEQAPGPLAWDVDLLLRR